MHWTFTLAVAVALTVPALAQKPEPVATIAFDGGANSLSFTPDGKTIVAGCFAGSNVGVIDVDTGKVARMLHKSRFQSSTARLSPDGKIVAARVDTGLKIWELATGKELHSLKGEDTPMAFTPDGKSLLMGSMYGARAGGVMKWLNVETGQPSEAPKDWPKTKASPNPVVGTKFAVTGTIDAENFKTEIQIYDWPPTALKTSLTVLADSANPVALSPDGNYLAHGVKSGQFDGAGEAWLWDVEAKKRLRILKGHTREVSCLRFTPDGKTLITGAGGYGNDQGECKLWNVTDQKEICTLREPHKAGLIALAVSPDGKLLATSAYQDGKIVLWKLPQ